MVRPFSGHLPGSPLCTVGHSSRGITLLPESTAGLTHPVPVSKCVSTPHINDLLWVEGFPAEGVLCVTLRALGSGVLDLLCDCYGQEPTTQGSRLLEGLFQQCDQRAVRHSGDFRVFS